MPDLPLLQIYPNPEQPRKHFDQAKLEELAASIKENGLIEPIVVVERPDGYMIVGGERRWRACQIAGLEKAPARVIEADQDAIARLALIENLQREDLSLIEEAKGYQAILDTGVTVEELARDLGFKQAWRITERTSLLRLDPVYQDALLRRIITPSQAFEMSRLPVEGQHTLFRWITEGRAEGYNKLRSLANALLTKPMVQEAFFAPPSEEEQRVTGRYEMMLEKVNRLIEASFDEKDLTALSRGALNSDLGASIEKLDLTIRQLNRVKRALIEAQSARSVALEAA